MNNHNEYICVCIYTCTQGFPGGSDGKESACNARDLGLSPGLERSPREGNGYPLQYSIFFFFCPTPVFLPGDFHGQKSLAG